MKKLLVAVVALVMTGAFAQDHNHKHMVTFSGFDDAGFSNTFDVSFSEEDANDTTDSNIALNYTYAINGSWMVGADYRNRKVADETNDANFSGYGVHGYYNLNGTVNDTSYVKLSYFMTDYSGDDNEDKTLAVAFGHRFSLGSWDRFHLTFSPSVSYSATDAERANGTGGTDDTKYTSLAWNWIKFDLLF